MLSISFHVHDASLVFCCAIFGRDLIDAGKRGTNMQPPSGFEANSPSESAGSPLRFASETLGKESQDSYQDPVETHLFAL